MSEHAYRPTKGANYKSICNKNRKKSVLRGKGTRQISQANHSGDWRRT